MSIIYPNWPAPATIKACTTTRLSWENKSLFTATNSTHVKKSKLLQQTLSLPNEPIWINQTHSIIAIEAIADNCEKEADASYSAKPNHICTVITADCLPVLICNQQGTLVSAIHAGWRGLANGILENTLSKLNCAPETLLVWFGPAIGPQKFEVGEDVYLAFTKHHPEAATAFIPHTEGKWHANLYALAILRLQKQGIKYIYGGDYCTFTQDDLFFSYRRDKGQTGRMASLIWIAD